MTEGQQDEPTPQTERWQRRERKLRKRREAIQESGAGLKKVILPLVQKKAEEAEKRRKRGAGDEQQGRPE